MSTKEQEAQQAQTIARVKLALNNGVAYTELKQFMRDMLEIVDSQAQKLKEQAETIATNAAYAIELQGKIAEQAKEIERLNTQIRLMEYRYNDMGDLDYNEPDWLARLKSLSPDGKL